jgi:glycosyltransferase involved in cell wall biosynthesis
VGELDSKIKEEIEKLGISQGWNSFIYFVGRKEEEELAELLQSSDAFVLFSNYETQAIVLLEAICCGTPVIATKTGGVAEYVNDKNGILIEPKNEEQLYNAAVSIIKERNKFGTSAEIRVTVVDMVNADSIAKQYMEVYNKVLSNKK